MFILSQTNLFILSHLTKHILNVFFMLLQVETGIKYSDQVDVVPCRYAYEETDEFIEVEEDLEDTEN